MLYGAAESLFKLLNTNVKLVYRLPRSTLTYFVEGNLDSHFSSIRNSLEKVKVALTVKIFLYLNLEDLDC